MVKRVDMKLGLGFPDLGLCLLDWDFGDAKQKWRKKQSKKCL